MEGQPIGTGTLSVIRDSGHTGSLCSVGLFVDGKVGALEKGSSSTYQQDLLSWVRRIKDAVYVALGTRDKRQESDALITGEKVKDYRISTSGDRVLDILPASL